LYYKSLPFENQGKGAKKKDTVRKNEENAGKVKINERNQKSLTFFDFDFF